MSTIKLNKDEILRMAAQFSSLKTEVNNILIKTQNTEGVLKRETSVSTYSQRNKLTEVQDLAYNLVREFDKISDNFYQAARTMESAEEKILSRISFISDSILRFIKTDKIYSGSEINNFPKRISYRKNGFLYIYELKETPLYNLFGTDFYGDFGIYDVTGDKEYANLHKLYKYKCVYTTEPEVAWQIVDVSTLRNIQNFRRGSLEHIFEGEINWRGKAVGLHYEDYPTTRGSIINGTKSPVDELGVYKGKVQIDGVQKVSNSGYSTFFPEEFTPQQVVDAINEAYINRQFVQGTESTYIGNTSSGLKIEMYLNNAKKIKSAFPKL